MSVHNVMCNIHLTISHDDRKMNLTTDLHHPHFIYPPCLSRFCDACPSYPFWLVSMPSCCCDKRDHPEAPPLWTIPHFFTNSNSTVPTIDPRPIHLSGLQKVLSNKALVPLSLSQQRHLIPNLTAWTRIPSFWWKRTVGKQKTCHSIDTKQGWSKGHNAIAFGGKNMGTE